MNVLGGLVLLATLMSAGGAAPQVLYDARLPAREPHLTAPVLARVLALARGAVRAGAWDVALACPADEITVNGAVPGAFTGVGARQTAYLYTVCFARTGSAQGLLVLDGANAAAHFVFVADDYDLRAVADLNRNGVTELALSGQPTTRGVTRGTLDVAELFPQGHFLARLNASTGLEPYRSDCGGAATGWRSVVLRASPGAAPHFTAQELRGHCGTEGTALPRGPERPVTVKATALDRRPAPLR